MIGGSGGTLRRRPLLRCSWPRLRRAASLASVQVFSGAAQPLQKRDLAIPQLRDGEVLVKMEMATICGSDLHTMHGLRQEPIPLVLGHEGIGTVVKSNRPSLSTGSRISFSVADSCFTCRTCTNFHLPQKCETLFKYGHASIHDGSGLNGCYSSHIILRPGTHTVTIPSSLKPELVAPANCALATVANCLEEGPLIPQHRFAALVQGAGLLGLYSIAWLKNVLGFHNVICVDSVGSRLNLASEFGAIAVKATANNTENRLQTLFGIAPLGVDLVIEAAGSADVFAEGIQSIRPGGTYVLAGMVHPQTSLAASTGESIIRKSIVIRGAHNYAPRHLDAAINFVIQHSDCLPLHRLVSPSFPLDNLGEAFALAKTKQWSRVAVVPN